MGRHGASPSGDRLRLYRAGRDRLQSAGYEQVSLRFFRRSDAPRGPDTCCQEDGMVGLGCGARSYTRQVHYASHWAVGREPVRAILDAYVSAPETSFDVASYGVELSPDEQRRRYAIKTLLRRDGLPLEAYRAWFGTNAESDLPELTSLVAEGLAVRRGDHLALTAQGFELSDAIGPALYSPETRDRMGAFELT
jgi:oxygen-independent coproporphyrinogen-3 oxidase